MERKSRLEFAGDNLKVGEFNFREINTPLDECVAIELFNEDKNIVFTKKLNETNIAYLTNELDDKIDILFTPNYNINFADFDINVLNIVCNNSDKISQNINNLFYSENFTIDL